VKAVGIMRWTLIHSDIFVCWPRRVEAESRCKWEQQARTTNRTTSDGVLKRLAKRNADLVLMRRIDELHLEYPFAAARMLRDLLDREGFTVGRLHVSTLMKRMGIEDLPPDQYQQACARLQGLSLPARRLPVTRPNHVWAIHITYIPMASGFV
jgi:transposase InsO family protein